MRTATELLLVVMGGWCAAGAGADDGATTCLDDEWDQAALHDEVDDRRKWTDRPVPIPPLPPLDPLGERIRRELRRRRGAAISAELPLRELRLPPPPLRRRAEAQRRSEERDSFVATRRFESRRQLNRYFNDVADKVVGDKAMWMAQEALYAAQEKLREMERASEEGADGGKNIFFQLGYTIMKIRGVLKDCYVIYTVLYRYKFKEHNWRNNVVTSIYYYTYCFKKYIDIIYYVEAVMAAYKEEKGDENEAKHFLGDGPDPPGGYNYSHLTDEQKQRIKDYLASQKS